jgi:hypothetical protein
MRVSEGIGQAVPRREDDRYLRGKGEFIADIRLAGMHDLFGVGPGDRAKYLPPSLCGLDAIAIMTPANESRIDGDSDCPRVVRRPYVAGCIKQLLACLECVATHGLVMHASLDQAGHAPGHWRQIR